MNQGIIIIGLNGSGKTTLARALAEVLNYKHMDIEDYVFEQSDLPYSMMRQKIDYTIDIYDDINKHKNYVLSILKGDLGEAITATYSLLIYLEVPLGIRLERVKKRMIDQHGSRVLPGGDMYESELNFLQAVKAKSSDMLEAWMSTLSCPKLRLDGRRSIEENVIVVRDYLKKGDKMTLDIIDLGDRLIEVAQSRLMELHQGQVLIDLTTYAIDQSKVDQLLTYLRGQEIRLFEDVSDEEGMIVDSKESYTPIFNHVALSGRTLELSFSQSMIDMLT